MKWLLMTEDKHKNNSSLKELSISQLKMITIEETSTIYNKNVYTLMQNIINPHIFMKNMMILYMFYLTLTNTNQIQIAFDRRIKKSFDYMR